MVLSIVGRKGVMRACKLWQKWIKIETDDSLLDRIELLKGC